MNTRNRPVSLDSTSGFRRPALVAALLVAALAPALHAAETMATTPPPATTSDTLPATPAVLIVVRNAAGETLAGCENPLEDAIAAQVTTSSGLGVISRADAVRRLATSGKTEADLAAAKIDNELDNHTSALNLARNLAANGLICVTVQSLGKETLTYNGNGIATVNTKHTLRASWKILDAGRAQSVVGGTETASKQVRQVEGLLVISDDVLNELLSQIAGKIAAAVKTNVSAEVPVVRPEIPVAAATGTPATTTVAKQLLTAGTASKVDFTVVVRQPSTTLQQMSRDKNDTPQFQEDKSIMPLDGASVELDGFSIGTAPFPSPAKVTPGLHKLRVTRPGFTPYEKEVSITGGTSLDITLMPTKEYKDEMKKDMTFMELIKAAITFSDTVSFAIKLLVWGAILSPIAGAIAYALRKPNTYHINNTTNNTQKNF